MFEQSSRVIDSFFFTWNNAQTYFFEAVSRLRPSRDFSPEYVTKQLGFSLAVLKQLEHDVAGTEFPGQNFSAAIPKASHVAQCLHGYNIATTDSLCAAGQKLEVHGLAHFFASTKQHIGVIESETQNLIQVVEVLNPADCEQGLPEIVVVRLARLLTSWHVVNRDTLSFFVLAHELRARASGKSLLDVSQTSLVMAN